MKKKLFSLLVVVFVLSGVLNIGLLTWNRAGLGSVFIQDQLNQEITSVQNSLKLMFEKINAFRIVQTNSETLEEALLTEDKEEVYDELVTMINQAENVAGFNLEELRLYLLKKDKLIHFLSVHDTEETAPPTEHHARALKIKVQPVSGLRSGNFLKMTLLHYFAVFNFETGSFDKEGVIELGVNLKTYLGAIKDNFSDAETALIKGSEIVSTNPVLFDQVEGVLKKEFSNRAGENYHSINVEIEAAQESNDVEAEAVSRGGQQYRFDFIAIEV